MKNRFLLLVLFTCCLFCLFSESWNPQITAYKRNIASGTVPAPVCNLFRILDVTSSDMAANEVEWIPANYRNVNYDAFSWVLGGNVFGPVVVSFEFGPMYIDTLSQDDFIPYDVILSHTGSRIGNTTITSCIGSQTATTSYVTTNDFSTYSYYYMDSISFTGGRDSVSVINSPQSITITYDMSDKTVVKDGNTEINNYPYNVCNYWNRYGSGTIKLKIATDGSRLEGHPYLSNGSTKFSSGNYYADVVVSITSTI